jgi:hypothetical protein
MSSAQDALASSIEVLANKRGRPAWTWLAKLIFWHIRHGRQKLARASIERDGSSSGKPASLGSGTNPMPHARHTAEWRKTHGL